MIRPSGGGGVPWGLLAALTGALAQTAGAAPLTLYELDEMPLALACRDVCAAQPATDRPACQSACQYQVVDPGWEKNGTKSIDRSDWLLAILEYWDGSSNSSICIEGDVVKPIAECGGACSATHTKAECEDNDKDGLLAWEEAAIGTSDSIAQVGCATNAQCDFATECDFQFKLGRSYCLPRACAAANSCTAFHLEQVAANDKEVILRVNFDYAPTPPTVLDLRVLFSATNLVLVDARALPLLAGANKGVSVTQPAAGVLRLVVLGEGSMDPIPTGAIIELVFQRLTDAKTSVRFDPTDVYQRNAMAPSQGAAQASLTRNELWGNDVELSGTAGTGPRLLLSYPFDSLENPRDYTAVPSPEELCGWVGNLACPELPARGDDLLRRVKTVAALGMLQAGTLTAKTLIDGVSGKAAYFDGTWDRLDLPVVLNQPLLVSSQASSLSVWVLPEGRSADELVGGHQVLWSHQRADLETTRYGIRADENPADPSTVDLSWFDDGKPTDGGVTGDEWLTDPRGASPRLPFAVGLPLHKWVHLGMSLDPAPGTDAPAGTVRLFIDGALARTVPLQKSPALSCPGLGTEAETSPPVALHLQGDNGTRTGDLVYLATPLSGLFGIDRMDPSGAGRAAVVRPSDGTVDDPDYSPLVDKLVYSSNQSGNAEIWLSNGDGSNPQQLTTGFGDAVHAVFARRPRWAPDASAIVFESNAFTQNGDNPERVYHLYYLRYDTTPGAPLPSMSYPGLVQSQKLYTARLTAGARHHTGARWLKGRGSGTLGEITYSSADTQYVSQVETLILPGVFIDPAPTPGVVEVGSAADFESSVRLLAARGRLVSGVDHSRSLMLHERSAFVPAASFSLSLDIATGGEATVVRVLHTPAADCTGKCLPVEVPALYLAYNQGSAAVDFAGSRAGSGIEVGPLSKTVELSDVGFNSPTQALRFVKIRVTSNTAQPIAAGAELAVIRFVSSNQGQALGLALKERVSTRSLLLLDRARGKDPLPLVVRTDLLEEVEQAEFSGDGTQLLLSGVSRSRPTLLRAALVDPSTPTGAFTLKDEAVIETTPARIDGMSWTSIDRFSPCTRFGATRHPGTGLYQDGFRGALDELKVYNYVRDPGAFLSDAQRGHDWLRAAGRDGVLRAISPSCTGLDTECPPFMVCKAGRCERQTCDPTDAGTCAGHGLCAYRPLPIEDEMPDASWLCSSECNTDTQCFQHDCLNGPCRFCTAGACNECNVVTKNYGPLGGADGGRAPDGGLLPDFVVTETVGCPDSNSWACENGNCVSQCYRVESGVSKYVCNPTEEYCLRGRCTPMQWDWSELGPSSLMGLGEMKLAPLTYTTATPQRVPIEIRAYGVEDYAHSPEILVEGRIADSSEGFLARWFTIGRVLVYNRTDAEAKDRTYTVMTEYPITELRLRLVTPPLQNFGAASTGYGFPGEDIHRAAGSQFLLGYPLNIPTWQVYSGCDADPTTWAIPGQPQPCVGKLIADKFRQYLRGGQPAVVVLGVKVNGSSVMKATDPDGGVAAGVTTNRICSYEGTDAPAVLENPAKKLFYGDISTEVSNEKGLYCQRPGVHCDASPTSVVTFNVGSKGVALLNCNYFDPQNPTASAGLTMSFTKPILAVSGDLVETANSCEFIEVVGEKRISTSCYEIADGDGSFDVMNAPQGADENKSFGLLDFDIFRFFAWDSTGP